MTRMKNKQERVGRSDDIDIAGATAGMTSTAGISDIGRTRQRVLSTANPELALSIYNELQAHIEELEKKTSELEQANEALSELDRMKSEFISKMSHELRTPLHAIKGFAKLMLRGKTLDLDTNREYLTIIDREGEVLDRLISDLLDVSRLESGRFRIHRRRTSLKSIIRNCLGTCAVLASDKGIVINEDIPATMPEVEIDGERVGQVILNLLSNAIKYSGDGGIITLKSEVRDGELVVGVIDQGPGIPEEAVPHLFERFSRVEDSAEIEGIGLGLYISRQIIEAHGGSIWVESDLGKGSSFYFSVPLLLGEKERAGRRTLR